MYDMLWAKVNRLAGNRFRKKHLKQPFLGERIGITSLWEDLDDKLLTPGQLLGYP